VHLPLAFSIHHFVSSVGADAGFAAIVGLAILVLLYFAQARETSSLRDQSVAASQRVAELEHRVAQLGGAGVTGAPEEARQAVQRQPLPAAPAGVAAPALAAATRLIPLAAPVPAAPVGASVAERVTATPPPPTAPRPAPAATPPPVTAAAGARTPAPVAAPEPAATPSPNGPGSNGTGEHTIARPAAAAPAPRPLRTQTRPSATFNPRLPPLRRPRRRSRIGRLVPALVTALLVATAVAVLLVVTSTGGPTRSSASSKTTNAPSARTPHKAAFRPSSVTVAVLNGTDVFQLAHRVALRLHGVGFTQGAVATATDQTHATTLVGYLPGNRHDAVEVAKALKLPVAAVAPVDSSAQAVACPPPTACRAAVIVTVGADLSNTP
jgi:hypothetical protein